MKERKIELTSAGLHILAMAFMLSDHAWAAMFPNTRILTCIGRLAYPIFAFMLVEGFFHTRDLKRYLLRMLGFALISEIPFDILYSGIPVFWFHQNVLWTFLIALLGMALCEKIRGKWKIWFALPGCALVVICCFLVSLVCMTDFWGHGILTIFTFYFFRERKWWCFLGQLVLLSWINIELMGGMYYPIHLGGMEFELVEQGLALLALIPIWMYRGKKGHSSKWFQYFCYSFYPVHCLLLGLYAIL